MSAAGYWAWVWIPVSTVQDLFYKSEAEASIRAAEAEVAHERALERDKALEDVRPEEKRAEQSKEVARSWRWKREE